MMNPNRPLGFKNARRFAARDRAGALSREEIKQIREWIDDYLEDQLELTDEVKAKLDQSRREIAAGQYTTRQAE